jgi:hypothetical protein
MILSLGPLTMLGRALVALLGASFLARKGCSALASSDSCGNIPVTLQVPEGFSGKEAWQQFPVTPLQLTLGQVKPLNEISVSTMLQQQTGVSGSIAFVVRRPG